MSGASHRKFSVFHPIFPPVKCLVEGTDGSNHACFARDASYSAMSHSCLSSGCTMKCCSVACTVAAIHPTHYLSVPSPLLSPPIQREATECRTGLQPYKGVVFFTIKQAAWSGWLQQCLGCVASYQATARLSESQACTVAAICPSNPLAP